MTNEPKVNREYKDRLFTFIFGKEENREWTLSLYNAVNGSHYTDASLIEFNTLKDVLFMGMRNDTSFLISDVLSVYEHQSTYCSNLPLRLLEYVSDIYTGYITKNKINKYRNRMIPLPTPKLVAFYNGTTDTDDEVILKLTDSFKEEHRSEADVEVRVRMLNVNYGRNKNLLAACKPLEEYSWLIAEIRKNQKDHEIIEATKQAIEAMPDDFGIKSFLLENQKEVEGMLDTEYNEEEVWQMFQNDVDEERKRADNEKARADQAESKLSDIESKLQAALAEIERLKAAQSQSASATN